jgi:hypothetical protein
VDVNTACTIDANTNINDQVAPEVSIIQANLTKSIPYSANVPALEKENTSNSLAADISDRVITEVSSSQSDLAETIRLAERENVPSPEKRTENSDQDDLPNYHYADDAQYHLENSVNHDHDYCDEGCYRISSSEDDDVVVEDEGDIPLDFNVKCTDHDDIIANVFPDDYQKGYNILHVKCDNEDTTFMSGDIITAKRGEKKVFIGVLIAQPQYNSNMVPIHLDEKEFKQWLSSRGI